MFEVNVKKAATTGLFACTLGFAGFSNAGVFDISGPAATNVDTDPATVIFLNVLQTGTITDINVELVIRDDDDDDQPCCYIDNLDITLSHTGVDVLLYPGGDEDTSESNMDAIFDDAAAAPAPTEGSVVGTFQPVDPLSGFNGQSLAGQWALTIFDHDVPNDGTDLISWRIFGTTAEEVPVPATLALLGLGLVGIGYQRRKQRKAV